MLNAPSARRAWLGYLLVLTLVVLAGLVIYPHDIRLSETIRGIGQLPGDLRRVLALSELVAHGSGVMVMLVAIWQLAPHLRLHLPRIAACGFVAGLAANGIKLVHARIRPLTCPPEIVDSAATWRGWFPGVAEIASQPYDYAVQSFPSAHTATAMGFAIGLSWLYPRGRYLFFGMAILAGLQRIVFLAHWPSDVVFGAATGIFFGACFTLPGTIGNYLCNWLEWKLGLGRQPLMAPGCGDADGDPGRRAA